MLMRMPPPSGGALLSAWGFSGAGAVWLPPSPAPPVTHPFPQWCFPLAWTLPGHGLSLGILITFVAADSF